MSKETQKVIEATTQGSRYGQPATWRETVKGKYGVGQKTGERNAGTKSEAKKLG